MSRRKNRYIRYPAAVGRVFILAAITLTLLLVMACQNEEVILPEDSGVIMDLPDGRVTLSSESNRYDPGDTATFTVTFWNGTTATWSTEYCLLLVDGDEVMIKLAQGNIDLGIQEGNQLRIITEIPEALPNAVYGVCLLLPGSGSVTSPVWISTVSEIGGAFWFTPSGCAGGKFDTQFEVYEEPFIG